MNKIIEIVNNTEGLYSGNLRHYFKIAFDDRSASNQYHNFRHSMNTLCEGYEGAKYCRYPKTFGKLKFRALLIALMLHDLGHSGRLGNDSLEIAETIKLITRHLLKKDLPLFPLIKDFIFCSSYPHQSTVLHLGAEILRDADSSQTLTDVWFQQIIFGLAAEQAVSPLVCLKSQVDFLRSLKFYSKWGKEVLARRVPTKIEEVREFLELLK